MKAGTLRSDVLLLIAAAIWGFAFVAQRAGMEHVGPFVFNGVRFALGSASLIPLLVLTKKVGTSERQRQAPTLVMTLAGGVAAGVVLFVASSLQQVGLVYTTAGNAGFITGLYVVIVPILGLIWGQRPGAGTWVGAVLAAVGLYLLGVSGRFTIAHGDLLVLISALFWACHVLLIGALSRRIDPIRIAFLQFATCSVLSLITALIFESFVWADIRAAAIPILYGGVMSVGVGFTLQVVAQREANPAHAAILLSLEAVFAAFGGWLILGELLSLRGLVGCSLMLSGMLLSQLAAKQLQVGS
jgi:drug/metabolite transporter (DMT)-like permease